MFNEKSFKYPVKTFPSHKIKSDNLFFIPKEQFDLFGENTFSESSVVLMKDTEVLVLEHGVGLEAAWCKIKLEDESEGYILLNVADEESLISLYGIPFYNLNTEEKNLPNPNATQINWKNEKPNIAYEDAYNGAFVVHCELENVVQISSQSNLANKMSEAREKGLRIILEHAGFQTTEENITKLLNNYYEFCSAEEWFFDIRPCSTFRVAVVLPMRYLYARSDLLKDVNGSVSGAEEPADEEPPEEIFKLKFENFGKYEQFFASLIETLSRYNVTYLLKEWTISPEGTGVDLFYEIEQIKSFIVSTNDFIYKNVPKRVEVKPRIFGIAEVKVWKDSLEFEIDKNKLEIKKVKYYSGDSVYALSNGYAAYLNLKEVLNKTIVNYLINFDPVKDFYEPNSITDAAAKAPDEALKQLEAFFGDVLKTITGDARDEAIKTFLTTKHYPKIDDIVPVPLDITNCTLDSASRISKLLSVKLPEEKEKFEQMYKNYDKNNVSEELDAFKKYFQNGFNEAKSSFEFDADKDVSNRYLRIILGADELKGYSELEKVSIYFNALNSVDWAKFLAFATQCLMMNLPPIVVRDLLNLYKGARAFLEKLFGMTICNPFLTKALTALNGFQLPVIQISNASTVLAKELQNAFMKLIKDLIAEVIKQLLIEMAKICVNGPQQNPNNNNPAAPKNPFDEDANQNDPAIDDLLNDFNKLTGNPAGDKEQTRKILNEIIDDVSACLSLKEMCSLYNGSFVNDEVYQVISSLIKRKYGEPYIFAFATKEQVYKFFKTLGKNMDLSICADLQEDSPLGGNTGIFCDDGRVKNFRKQLLEDRGLPPELVEQQLQMLQDQETKTLEDVLKLLNSPNPFDFSKVPNLACQIFPSGVSVAPSMDSFSDMIGSLTKPIYDSFDDESEEWNKTTYSIQKSNSPQFLIFNSGSGKIELNPDVQISAEMGDGIRAASGKTDPKKQEEDSNKINSLNEIKLPAFMLKKSLKEQLSKYSYISSSAEKYISCKARLDGNLQKDLDINFISDTLSTNVIRGDYELREFCKRFMGVYAAKVALNRIPAKNLEIIMRLMNSYLINNPIDAEETKEIMKAAQKQLNITDAEESNGFFAQEYGTAIYIVLGELLFEENDWGKLSSALMAPQDTDAEKAILAGIQGLYDVAAKTFIEIKNYYKTIFKLKLTYPDFNIDYKSGMTSFVNDEYRDVQRIEILRNDNNYIRFLEENKVSDSVAEYITGTLSASLSSEMTKEKLFSDYLLYNIKKYGVGNTGRKDDNIIITADDSYNYNYINKKIYDELTSSIISINNKFIHLKDINSPYISSIAETGSGTPYTKFLQLKLPQTIKQKVCKIRPHYLDIDSIKDQIVDEKTKNICGDPIDPNKDVLNRPVSSRDLKALETSATQDSMLRGMYRLTVRIFLHDILLRGIPLFGVYDPQALRDEPAFITFMTKIVESEMRGMDNGFYIMMSEFFLKQYQAARPKEKIDDVKKRKYLLLRDLVKTELQTYVLPKLAKRIISDTNQVLINNIPQDNQIQFKNMSNYLLDIGILSVDENGVYIDNTLGFVNENNINTPQVRIPVGKQKIFEVNPADMNIAETDPEKLSAAKAQYVYKKFMLQPQYEFITKFLFPVTQSLNYLFILSCLSTGTRRQVVNSFLGTKRYAIRICKSIQAGGLSITPDPNDMQANAESDPWGAMIGFFLKAVITTPLKIIKGVAEGSEPNIALTSTVFKLGRAFEPKLPSIIIPAASLPLGLIPTPITCPLPFVNPLLVMTYFATFGWYDEEGESNTDLLNKAFEEAAKKPKEEDCSGVKNQDLYYLNGDPIQKGVYTQEKDIESLKTNLNALTVLETTPEEMPIAGKKMIENESIKMLEEIFDFIKQKQYTYTNSSDSPVSESVSDFITQDQSSYETFIAMTKQEILNVEELVNTRKSISANDDPNDNTEDGTFRLIPPDSVKYINKFFPGGVDMQTGKLILSLRKNTDYKSYSEAFRDAYTSASSKAQQKIINHISDIKAAQNKQTAVSSTASEETPPATSTEAAQNRTQNRVGGSTPVTGE